MLLNAAAKFMNNIKIKELKLEWIYIATTTDQFN
jgi:hypothetical protein